MERDHGLKEEEGDVITVAIECTVNGNTHGVQSKAIHRRTHQALATSATKQYLHSFPT